MGRELARQLVARAATSPWRRVGREHGRDETALSGREAAGGLRITTHIADVSIEDQVLRFRDEVAEQQQTDKIHLLFNNAGIGGGGSMVANPREQWDKTFGCAGAAFTTTRAPTCRWMKATEGHIVNTSSVNGFWASIGPGVSHTLTPQQNSPSKGLPRP